MELNHSKMDMARYEDHAAAVLKRRPNLECHPLVVYLFCKKKRNEQSEFVTKLVIGIASIFGHQ